jgi:hypothetical protein
MHLTGVLHGSNGGGLTVAMAGESGFAGLTAIPAGITSGSGEDSFGIISEIIPDGSQATYSGSLTTCLDIDCFRGLVGGFNFTLVSGVVVTGSDYQSNIPSLRTLRFSGGFFVLGHFS